MKQLLAFLICLFFLTAANAGAVVQMPPNFANNPDAKAFIQMMVKKYKFNQAELTALFSNVKMRPKIIQHVKAPLEQNPWYTYKRLYVTEERIANGVSFWKKYKNALSKAEKVYGVPANVIVATIGIESVYGQNIGRFSVLDALVNLSFGDTSRKDYFRKELEQFLLLTREQHLNPATVMGSYAGAIGQPQFMPSSYRYYAVNFSENKSVDLMHDEVDVIGSVANYYNKNGWKAHEPIAAPATKAADGIKPQAGHSPYKSKLLKLKVKNGYDDWFIYHNFSVIKRYNHSDLYAMAVYQISYFIAKRWNAKHV
jgi:membrane-bound lytic murein transglycosylase B